MATSAATGAPSLPVRRLAFLSDPRFWIALSLLAVYIIWGTTYLVIRFALEGFTPYWMMGLRFVVAGGALYLFLRARGAPNPTRRQWGSAALVGALLLGGGMGSVALAEETISSGLAATLVATSPLWTMIFGLLWRRIPSRGEWIGVAFGLVGVALLSLEGTLQANPAGIALLIFAPMAWALGSVWMKHLDMPEGMMGNAAEMLMGGLVLCGIAIVRGEPFPTSPTPGSLLALLYLITFGSLVTMSAYFYLLKNVSPTLATSYSFVNPAIALFLGVVLGGEILTGSALIALPIILLGVAFVFRAQGASRKEA
jgi:drug/metabolite transporter (DMT)-like permease